MSAIYDKLTSFVNLRIELLFVSQMLDKNMMNAWNKLESVVYAHIYRYLVFVILLNVVTVECLLVTGASTIHKVDMTLIARLGVEHTVPVSRYSRIIYFKHDVGAFFALGTI